MANRTIREDPSGWRLTLVVADKTTFTSDEDITLELSFANASSGPLVYNSGQTRFFGIYAAGSEANPEWTTETCQPEYGAPKGTFNAGVTMQPGEGGRFVGTYPAGQSVKQRQSCRLPPGSYLATGYLDWCPPGTTSRPNGGGEACDPNRVQRVAAEPLAITIG